MRILWIAPWFSTLATEWANGLRHRGHSVIVLTEASHFDPPPRHEDDIVYERHWRSAAGIREAFRARDQVRRFDPDVVITEAGWDPRYLVPVPAKTAVIGITHDAVAHDAANKVPLRRRLIDRYLERRLTGRVVFSEDVATRIGAKPYPVSVLPLTSELPEHLVPVDRVLPEERRDFYLVGRLSEYKNVELCIEAMEIHRASEHFRGDRLVLVGGGDPECSLPDHVVWERGRFRFSRLAELLPRAKASLCVYKAGSQSGVQVTSLQCGAPVVVSAVGGLPEYLAAGESPLQPLTAASLATRLGQLADPDVAAAEGQRGIETYQQRYSVAVTSEAWERVLMSACVT